MVWLSEISPWTWAALGLGWVGVSGALALVLGKVLARTNQAAEREELALARAEAARSVSQPAPQFEPTGDWFAQSSLTAAEDEEAYAGRASSGTRFKPIDVEDEGTQERPAQNVRSLRSFR
jgi:hypothetical protein